MRKFVLLLLLAGCVPSNIKISIPALEKIADAVVPPDTCPAPNDPRDIIDPIKDGMSAQEWTTIITGLLTALGVIVHRYVFHRNGGSNVPRKADGAAARSVALGLAALDRRNSAGDRDLAGKDNAGGALESDPT